MPGEPLHHFGVHGSREIEKGESKVKTWSKIGAIFAFILAALFLASYFHPVIAAEQKAEETVKIGLLDPMTGPMEYASRLYYAAVEFAVAEQNEKGGLLGKKVEILREDSQLKPQTATRKAKQLVLEDKVNFLGVGTGSHIGLAVQKVADGNKTIMINYGAMADEIHGKEFTRYAFRVSQNAYAFSSALSKWFAKQPYKTFYLINQDYAWGHDFAEVFKKVLLKEKPDAKFLGEDYHPVANKDFGPYISKVQASKAEVLITGNWGVDISNLLKQAGSLGLDVKKIGSTFAADPSRIVESGPLILKVVYPYDFMWDVDTPEHKDLFQRYHKRRLDVFKDTDTLTIWPESSIGHTINGFKFLFAAVEKAGSLDPEAIIKAWEGMKYRISTGDSVMRACDHQIILPMFVADKNPLYPFPWLGKAMAIPAEEAAIPATADYNPRCK